MQFVKIITLIVLVATFAFSEEEKKRKIGYRFEASLYDFSIKDVETDMGFGLGLGASFYFPYTYIPVKNLTLNPAAVLYLYKRTAYFDGGYSVDEALNLSIPLMFQYAPIENAPFYAEAGFQLGLGTKEFAGRTYTSRAIIDFGFALGAGYHISKDWLADFRCVIGIRSPDTKFDSQLNQFGIGITKIWKGF